LSCLKSMSSVTYVSSGEFGSNVCSCLRPSFVAVIRDKPI
jgi:hypothetical protein